MNQPTNELSNSRFLKACRGETPDAMPIWLMRQAGRYMAEYRAIREKHSMLDVINSPQLSAEVTLQPLAAFDLDAAIIFSDILPPLVGMGLDLDFVAGSGPQISNPIESADDVARLATPDVREIMGPTLEAISIVTAELTPRGIPLIGFAGAPFTLACYAIQGRGSKQWERAKQFMYSHPDSWDELMNRFVEIDVEYLLAQAEHGASALQVFDSWAGILSRDDYVRFIQPHNRRLFEKISVAGVPTINFSTGTLGHTSEVVACGGDVIGVDWRARIDDFRRDVPDNKTLQGNLDPTVLLAPWPEIKKQVDIILDSVGLAPHVFNLGHGILPATPIESVRRLVDYVHNKFS